MIRSLILGALLLGLPFAAAAQAPSGPVPVGTVLARREAIGKTADLVGRVEAVQRVDVRARVSGWLEAILFKDGQKVAKGTPLYKIERGQFQAALGQAQGALLRAKAARELTIIQLDRAEELYRRQAGTAVARDQAKAADEQAQGQILSDQSALQTAQINLDYTTISSPIDGQVGRTLVTVGNVVGPDSGVLTTIVSIDPMYVSFPVSQRDFLQAQRSGEGDASKIKIRLRFVDGTEYPELGQVDFVNVNVDRATDTILVRGTVPNRKGQLVDGQFARVQLLIGEPQQKVVVPQSALLADQGGVYVFVVEDGKAAVRRVKPGGEHSTDVIVESGLEGGEQVIVEGLQALRPGAAVTARPVAGSLERK